MPTALNTLTGIVDFQPDHVVNHVNLGQYLKVVPEGTKSLIPGMFKPGTVDEFEELNAPQPKDEPSAGDKEKN